MGEKGTITDVTQKVIIIYNLLNLSMDTNFAITLW